MTDRKIGATGESDLPVIGQLFRVGDHLTTCTGIEWSWMPPGDGDAVECPSRDVAEACAQTHGGHAAYRATYDTTW
jgi:hypothetical protein